MTSNTFEPKPDKRVKPLPAVPGAPERPAKKQHKGLKMIDNLSITWEPDWHKVLYELGITRT